MPYITETELSNYFQTIDEQAATIARLTADAVLNDMAWKDNQAALNKQAEEIIALKKACIVYHNQIINMQKAEEE